MCELETRNASTWKLLINDRHSTKLYDIITYVVYAFQSVIWIFGRGVSYKEVQSYIDRVNIAIIKQIDSNSMRILDNSEVYFTLGN